MHQPSGNSIGTMASRLMMSQMTASLWFMLFFTGNLLWEFQLSMHLAFNGFKIKVKLWRWKKYIRNWTTVGNIWSFSESKKSSWPPRCQIRVIQPHQLASDHSKRYQRYSEGHFMPTMILQEPNSWWKLTHMSHLKSSETYFERNTIESHRCQRKVNSSLKWALLKISMRLSNNNLISKKVWYSKRN